MKKKILFIIIVLISFSLNVEAAETTTFSIADIDASAGEDITVSVNMKNNPKFGLLGIKVNYDTNKLTYDSCSINGFDNAMMKGCDPNKDGDIVFYALTIYEEEDKLLDDTGDIFDIKFKINDDVTEDIPLELNITDYGETANTKLEYNLENGNIKLSNNIISESVNSKVDLSKEIPKEYKEDKIIWKSSNQEIATVDDEGNITFKKDGNVTITATTDDGEVILEKKYRSNKEIKDNNYKIYIIIGIILIISLVIFIVIKRKKKKKRA